jgi:hypothetical protein
MLLLVELLVGGGVAPLPPDGQVCLLLVSVRCVAPKKQPIQSNGENSSSHHNPQQAPPPWADAGQHPNFEQEHKELFVIKIQW